MRPLYRFQQFWRQLNAAALSAEASRQIDQILSAKERQLFDLFCAADQQHGYRVMQALIETGQQDLDLLTAALLHDVGKVRERVTILDRCLIVLGTTLLPNWVNSWGAIPLDQASRWQRPFIIRAQHPIWGAEMAAAVGTRPLAIALIARHQTKLEGVNTQEDRLLACLQWADDQN